MKKKLNRSLISASSRWRFPEGVGRRCSANSNAFSSPQKTIVLLQANNPHRWSRAWRLLNSPKNVSSPIRLLRCERVLANQRTRTRSFVVVSINLFLLSFRSTFSSFSSFFVDAEHSLRFSERRREKEDADVNDNVPGDETKANVIAQMKSSFSLLHSLKILEWKTGKGCLHTTGFSSVHQKNLNATSAFLNVTPTTMAKIVMTPATPYIHHQ